MTSFVKIHVVLRLTVYLWLTFYRDKCTSEDASMVTIATEDQQKYFTQYLDSENDIIFWLDYQADTVR